MTEKNSTLFKQKGTTLKKFVAMLLALVMVFALCACGSNGDKAAANNNGDYHLTLKLSHVFAPTEQLTIEMQQVAQRIKERTNGAIEMDVHETRDGRLVVIHDERLDRTTDGSGRICDHSFAELQQVNAAARFAGKYAPERIPSFDEYCEWASGESVGHNIEIKTDKIYYPDIERKIWATIERYGLEKKVMFSSFNHFSLRRILEISGNAVEVGALVLEDSIGGFPGYYCQQAGFACYHPPIELLTDENVRDCKEHGVKMNVWTVNDMAGLEQLHRWGCEGIITNFPGVASGWLRAQGE